MMHRKAPAKINLFLHMVGRRPNGYHELQSLVGFADICDEVTLTPAPEAQTTLVVTGPFAQEGLHENNTVLKVLTLIQEKLKVADSFHIELVKNLPVAAGLGGGSSDAAAMLHLLNDFYQKPFTQEELEEMAIVVGADVPACVRGQIHYMTGIGEQLWPCDGFDPFHIVLVNNGTPLSTPAVFKVYQEQATPFSAELALPLTESDIKGGWDVFLAQVGRNDLTVAAASVDPAIPAMLSLLQAQEGCIISRLCGSGGTCFGLFHQADQAQKAQNILRAQWPTYWIERGEVF